MASLQIRTIFKNFETVELYYITMNCDGQECIWKKTTEVKNGQERELQDSFFIDGSHRTELQTAEEIHQFLVDFLHKIEEKQKEDVDPDDNFETIFTFTDDQEEEQEEEWEGQTMDYPVEIERKRLDLEERVSDLHNRLNSALDDDSVSDDEYERIRKEYKDAKAELDQLEHDIIDGKYDDQEEVQNLKNMKNTDGTVYLDVTEENGKFYIHIYGKDIDKETIGFTDPKDLISKFNELVDQYEITVDETFDSSRFDALKSDQDPEPDPDPEPETFAVWEGYMNDLRKKILSIQKKCQKFGCDFHYEEVGEEIREVLSTDTDPVTGERIPVKCKFILIKAEGTAVVNGWEFVASVEHTEAGNIFSKALTQVEIPVRYRNTDSCICEHCQTKRIRKNTCIIRNTETGEFKQVGNSCLCDFTHGMSASFATWLASVKDIFREEENRPVSGCGYHTRYYDTKEVLQFTAETIRHFGYSKTENRGDSTRDQMERFFDFCHGNTKYWEDIYIEETRSLMKRVGFNPNSPEAVQMAEEALNWIADQDATNDYMHNLKTVCSLDSTTCGRFGLLVSLFPTYNRELELEAQRKAEREAGKNSQHVGNIGDKIEVKVASVRCITSWESTFGYYPTTTYVWKITDVDGNIFMWKTQKWLDSDVPPKTIRGTVKEHTEYRSILQTELTRCKVA